MFDRGDGPSVKRRRLNDSNSMDVGLAMRIICFPSLTIQPQAQGYYSQIELDDLKDFQASEGIALDMKNSQRYFESRAINEDTSSRQKVRCAPRNGKNATKHPHRSASHKHLVSLRGVWAAGKGA